MLLETINIKVEESCLGFKAMVVWCLIILNLNLLFITLVYKKKSLVVSLYERIKLAFYLVVGCIKKYKQRKTLRCITTVLNSSKGRAYIYNIFLFL